MRALLMILGVVFHAAFVYGPSDWLLTDPPGSAAFTWLGRALRLFRMPAFFILAGFFTRMSLVRHGAGKHLRSRVLRLGLPLLTTALLTTELQNRIVAFATANRSFDLDGVLATSSPSPWYCLPPMSHLWFLSALLALEPLALLLLTGWGHRESAAERAATALDRRSGPMILAGLLLLWTAVVVILRRVAPHLVQWSLNTWLEGEWLFGYAPYFILGVVVQARPGLLERLSRPRWWHLPAFLAFGAGRTLFRNASGWDEIVAALTREGMVLIACAWCFWIFRTLLKDGHSAWEWLARASYSVYLLHYFPVLAVGSWLMQYRWPSATKFLVVLSISLALPLFLHWALISRVWVLSWAFNGQAPRRR